METGIAKDMKNLKGKVAWITGGKRIGKKVAEILAKNGVNIVLSYNKSKKDAEETRDNVENIGVKSEIIKCDVSCRDEIRDTVNLIKNKFGKLDILILMASDFEKVKLEDINEEVLQKNFDVHVKGSLFCILESLKIMPQSSHIITFSEKSTSTGVYREYLPYVLTKGSIEYMTKELAPELGKKGVFINSIIPGPILKPADVADEYWKEIKSKSALNHNVADEEAVAEVANMVLNLSTAKSTGSTFNVNMGHIS